ncbi:hypothetical protein YC2023_023882 [Brassica napus]
MFICWGLVKDLIQVLTSGTRSQIEVHFVRIERWRLVKSKVSWDSYGQAIFGTDFVPLCLHLLCDDHFQEQRNKIKVDMRTTMVTITGLRISFELLSLFKFLMDKCWTIARKYMVFSWFLCLCFEFAIF